jgi:hypothetical protein
MSPHRRLHTEGTQTIPDVAAPTRPDPQTTTTCPLAKIRRSREWSPSRAHASPTRFSHHRTTSRPPTRATKRKRKETRMDARPCLNRRARVSLKANRERRAARAAAPPFLCPLSAFSAIRAAVTLCAFSHLRSGGARQPMVDRAHPPTRPPAWAPSPLNLLRIS